MSSRYAGLGGVGIGVLLGSLFGLRRGDVWLGSVLTTVWTVAGYGFLAFPEYRTRWSGSNSKFWYTIVGGLGPVVMLVPPFGPLLSGADGLPLVVFLGGVWIGDVYSGVALEWRSTGEAEHSRGRQSFRVSSVSRPLASQTTWSRAVHPRLERDE